MFFDEKEEIKKLQSQIEAYKNGINDIFGTASKGVDLTVNIATNYKQTVLPSITSLNEGLQNMIGAATDAETILKFLVEGSTEIQNAFGVSRQRLDDFKVAIADAGPELLRMGIGADKAGDIIIEVGKAFGNTGLVGREAITELAAASELTTVSVTELATSFRNVGVSVYDVGDTMRDVANYARSVGVSVDAVSKGVVSNLEKMNLYNFENGTKGLTKMAAQAARLGYDMGQTFTVAEKVFNPEGAIELAASLQRLGVASSQLLDPLRAMDLAQNDPEELQNEIINLTKTFTKFNSETGKFEILPGEKRRIREIANEMGILPDKLAEMSIKASEFDKKMKSIEFPTAKKEDQELIASLSQISGGTAVIQVKDETGKRVTKEVRQLSPEDIDRLKEQEAESSKTIEQLTIDQLDVMKETNASAAAIARRMGLGVATSEEALRAQKAGNVLTKTLFEQKAQEFQTSDVRDKASEFFSDIEKTAVGYFQGNKSAEDVLLTLASKTGKLIENAETVIKDYTVETIQQYIDQIKPELQKIYQPVIDKVNEENKNKNKVVEKTELEIVVKIENSESLNLTAQQGVDILEKALTTVAGTQLVKDAVDYKQLS
jgi:hypothetical protein